MSGFYMTQLKYDLIIVGAGICGLTAAIACAEAGKKVIILEAMDFAGGRARSVSHADSAHNLGANWFHGGDQNPFYQWASKRYDLGPVEEEIVRDTTRVFRDGQDTQKAFPAAPKLWTRSMRRSKTKATMISA